MIKNYLQQTLFEQNTNKLGNPKGEGKMNEWAEFKMPSIPFNLRQSRQKRVYFPQAKDQMMRIKQDEAALKQRKKDLKPNCNEFRSSKRMRDILDNSKSPSMMNADGQIVKRQTPPTANEKPLKEQESSLMGSGSSTVTKLSEVSDSTAASIVSSPQFIAPEPQTINKQRTEPPNNTPTAHNSDSGSLSTTKKKIKIKKDRQMIQGPNEAVLGKRFTKPFQLEHAELGATIASDHKLIQNKISLHSKLNGSRDFTEFNEAQLISCFNLDLVKFDMTSLETVYDHDTDDEQIDECKQMLTKELFDVINFFVKDDPLQICENFEAFQD